MTQPIKPPIKPPIKTTIIGIDRVRPIAERVLDQIEREPSGLNLTIARYENGREEGYVLTNPSSEQSVTFSEGRNSDDIVVYLVDWNNASDADTDVAFAAKRFFNPSKIDAAVQFIIKALRAKGGE
jgi:hypothetical protein